MMIRAVALKAKIPAQRKAKDFNLSDADQKPGIGYVFPEKNLSRIV